MIADFMMEPLQGSLFKRFRDLIMGALPTEAVKKVLIYDQVMGPDQKHLAHK